MLTACKAENAGELDSLLAVLRRFAAEAARDEARQFSATLPRAVVGVERIALSDLSSADEPPLLLVDQDAAETMPVGITVDLAAIEAELAAALGSPSIYAARRNG